MINYTELDFEHAEVVPDSRAKELRGAKLLNGVWQEPIFCASCGTQGGYVPAENMTFAFWLCNKCFETYGSLTCTMVIPDEVFYEKLKREQLDSFGRVLDNDELIQIVAEDATPLAKLIKEGR